MVKDTTKTSHLSPWSFIFNNKVCRNILAVAAENEEEVERLNLKTNLSERDSENQIYINLLDGYLASDGIDILSCK